MTEDVRSVLSEAIAHLADGRSLSRDEARGCMQALLAGRATPAETGAFLMGLRLKGETEDEVTGLVEAMRAAGVRISPRRDVVVDLCGTGGDGSGTFNISTAASIVVAGCGVAVAKHGNRSASSRCGSADVLEALGVPVDLPPERAKIAIEEHGFAFLFAPIYHPAMKHVAGVRRELGIRTVFNILGPLASPAGVTRQLVGIYDGRARDLLARVLLALGCRSAWVVHGAGRLDELSISGPTEVTVVRDGELARRTVRPEECGLTQAAPDALRGGDAATNARILERILAGERGPHRDAVVLNSAAALVVAGVVADLAEGARRAVEAVDSGAAARVLEEARRFR